jgi:hypothetical protein
MNLQEQTRIVRLLGWLLLAAAVSGGTALSLLADRLLSWIGGAW